MKLDRNTNADGRGKYALINLRTNQVQWGTEPGDQFFVIKYKDKFAAPALMAYAEAAREEAARLRHSGNYPMALEVDEWAEEVQREAKVAEQTPNQIPT